MVTNELFCQLIQLRSRNSRGNGFCYLAISHSQEFVAFAHQFNLFVSFEKNHPTR